MKFRTFHLLYSKSPARWPLRRSHRVLPSVIFVLLHYEVYVEIFHILCKLSQSTFLQLVYRARFLYQGYHLIEILLFNFPYFFHQSRFARCSQTFRNCSSTKRITGKKDFFLYDIYLLSMYKRCRNSYHRRTLLPKTNQKIFLSSKVDK